MAEENQSKKIKLERIENWAKTGRTCFDMLDLESEEFSRLFEDIFKKKGDIENLAANFGGGFPDNIKSVCDDLDNYRNKWTSQRRKESANNLKQMFQGIIEGVDRQRKAIGL